MTANDLKHRIDIYKYNRSENEAGTPIDAWLYYKTTYAKISVPTGNSQNLIAEGRGPGTVVDFTIRQDDQISYNCEVRYNGQVYKINYIEPLKYGRFLKLTTITFNEYE